MKKIVAILALFSVTAVFAGGEPTQGLVHRHVVSLTILAAANLPPKEEVLASRPLPDYIHVAYATKQLLAETSKPWQWNGGTFKNAEHFWYTVRKTPQNQFPGLACILENEDCSRSFIKHAQTPNNNALLAAAYWGNIDNNIDTIRRHLDASADVHTDDDAALGFAAQLGYTDCVELLIDRGADIHADNDYALQRACYNGHEKTVRCLLKHGADKTAGEDTKDALYWAIRGGQVALLPLLIDTGDQETRNRALMVAAEWNQREAVEFLINAGADLHAEQDAPFRSACEHGHTELAHYLLSQGADIHAVHDDAFTSAAKNGHADIVYLLVNHDYFSDATRKEALILAAKNNFLEIVDFLIEEGTDLSINYYGYEKIVRELQFRGLSKELAQKIVGKIIKQSEF